MGLKDFIKNAINKVSKAGYNYKPYKVDQKEKEWYLSEQGKTKFLQMMEEYREDMAESWNNDRDDFICFYSKRWAPTPQERERLIEMSNWPCIFIRDCLYALGYSSYCDDAYVGVMTVALFESGVSFEDIFSSNKNPFLKLFVNWKKTFAEDISYVVIRNLVYDYIWKAYKNGVDATNESWMYEKSTYLTDDEINIIEPIKFVKNIRGRVKYPKWLVKLSDEEEHYYDPENVRARKIMAAYEIEQEKNRQHAEKLAKESAENSKKLAEKESQAAAARIRCAKCASYSFCASRHKNVFPYCPSFRDKK